jgi:hypothetical protein
MRFLLISDTHGRLAVIDEPAYRVRSDEVIHASDFGFFDDGSFERLSDRELRLHVAHSDLPRIEKDRILTLSRNDMIRTAREHRSASLCYAAGLGGAIRPCKAPRYSHGSNSRRRQRGPFSHR